MEENECITPTKKKRKLKQRQFSESDDEIIETKDEIRIKKQVLSSLESFYSFYQLSQKLMKRILDEMCNEINDIGCLKITRTFGNLSKFKSIDSFHKLKNYQQCGVHWLSIIHNFHSSNAILADEMGLGKTVQVCIFLQYLYNNYINSVTVTGTTDTEDTDTEDTDTEDEDIEDIEEDIESTGTMDSEDIPNTVGPSTDTEDVIRRLNINIIIVPLNIMYNWYNELKLWTNIKNIIIYHGTQSQRINILQYLLNLHYQFSNTVTGPTASSTNTNSTTDTNVSTNSTKGTLGPSTVTKGKGANSTAMECTSEKISNEIAVVTKTRESGTFLDSKDITEGDTKGVTEEVGEEIGCCVPHSVTEGFIIIITTFGMINDDIKLMKKLQPFEYLIIDEAHLIKNSNSNIYKKLSNYQFNHKLLITGTPIQNNMNELCNLLQFSMNSFNSYDINNSIYNILYNEKLINSFIKYKSFIQIITQSNTNNLTTTMGKGANDTFDTTGKGANDTFTTLGKGANFTAMECTLGKGANFMPMECTTEKNSNEIAVVTNFGESSTFSEGVNTKGDTEGDTKEVGEEVGEDTGTVGPSTVTEKLKKNINNIIELNNKKYKISKELKILQKLTTPFILRRLKKNVINELPIKYSNFIPCHMINYQYYIYQSFINPVTVTGPPDSSTTGTEGTEVNSITTTTDVTNTNSTINNLTTSSSTTTGKGTVGPSTVTEKNTNEIAVVTNSMGTVCTTKDSSTKEAPIGAVGEEVEETPSGGLVAGRGTDPVTEEINNKIYKLRRICNHPLLIRKIYEDEMLPKISKIIKKLHEEFHEYNLNKIIEYLFTLSDFNIHQLLLQCLQYCDSPVTVFPVTVLGPTATNGPGTEVSTVVLGTKDNRDIKVTTGTVGASTVTEGKGANFTAIECTSGKGANSMGMKCTSEKNPNEIAVVTKTGESSTFSEVEGKGANSMVTECTMGNMDTKDITEESSTVGVGCRGTDTVTELKNYINKINKKLYLESTKIRKMLELISKIIKKKEKILIFSQFTNYLDIIEYIMKLENMKPILRLDGTVTLIEREKIIKKFNNEDVYILLISIKVGNVGLNLSIANHVILMDQSWNPYNDIQAEDRCHRIGQQKIVYVYKLYVKNTIEEYIINQSYNKLQLNSLFNHH
uniref:DEAD-box family (SNF2-like) helicase, putative n=1 Tax=Theileria annulata TaxID=5874 RepID=A0A3B0NCJ3_THEAN